MRFGSSGRQRKVVGLRVPARNRRVGHIENTAEGLAEGPIVRGSTRANPSCNGGTTGIRLIASDREAASETGPLPARASTTDSKNENPAGRENAASNCPKQNWVQKNQTAESVASAVPEIIHESFQLVIEPYRARDARKKSAPIPGTSPRYTSPVGTAMDANSQNTENQHIQDDESRGKGEIAVPLREVPQLNTERVGGQKWPALTPSGSCRDGALTR